MDFSGKEAETGVVYGINRFDVPNAFVYTGTRAQFYLPGYTGARQVFISGSFNNWSTTEIPMRKAGKGWMTDLKLDPDKYTYKYIIDGHWSVDPVNKLRERGDAGAWNSVVYCYNHTFSLKGYQHARSVVVTGNFFSWNPKGLAMHATSDGWALESISGMAPMPINSLLTVRGSSIRPTGSMRKTNMEPAIPFCGSIRLNPGERGKPGGRMAPFSQDARNRDYS